MATTRIMFRPPMFYETQNAETDRLVN